MKDRFCGKPKREMSTRGSSQYRAGKPWPRGERKIKERGQIQRPRRGKVEKVSSRTGTEKRETDVGKTDGIETQRKEQEGLLITKGSWNATGVALKGRQKIAIPHCISGWEKLRATPGSQQHSKKILVVIISGVVKRGRSSFA